MLGLAKDAMDTAIHVALFSGKPKDCLAWMEKFLAKAKCKNLKHIYLMDLSKKKIPTAVELENLDQIDPDDKILIDLVKVNEDAYSELIMSINMNTMAGMMAFRIVVSTTMTEYPGGNAPIAWIRLKVNYQLDTGVALTWIAKEFYAMDMNEGQDPEICIAKLEYNQYRMEELGAKIPNNQFRMHIINNLPAEHVVAVNLLMWKFRRTLEELRADLQNEYDQLKAQKHSGNNNNNNDNNMNGEEHALFVGSEFKGKCHHCRQHGHQIGACWVKKDLSKKPSVRGGPGGGQQRQGNPGHGGHNQGGWGGQKG
jgi:gag-polypeptide of LTR copia-type